MSTNEHKGKEAIIQVKRLTDFEDALEYIAKLEQYSDLDKLVIDFSVLEYVKMLPVSLFARELRQVVHWRKEHGFETYSRGHDVNKSVPLSYLSFIGFFDFIGLKGIGLKVRYEAEVTCANPYLAITSYDYRRFKTNAEYDAFRREYDYISEEAVKISRLLNTHNDEKNSMMSYAIREIMRNAYEHSGTVNFYVMGQTWRDGSAELVIMDDGMGMLKSLKRKYPNLSTERDAILASMEPGVSGSDFGNNRYNNSGFGLYVLSEFAKRHGYICIASGDCAIKAGAEIEEHHIWNDGTFVALHLDEIPPDTQEELSEIIKRGEVVSQQGEYPTKPSKETWNF